MLPGSELIQALLVEDYLKHKDVVFVGDGDCMGLVIAHLANKKIIKRGPTKIRILDFDERILEFIEIIISEFRLPSDLISFKRYNVRDPIPENLSGAHDVFYTNPPYGSKDNGNCGNIFLGRCMELCKPAPSWGIALLPFAHKEDWSRQAMYNIQKFLTKNGYVVSEMIREIHQYHLDDRPSLMSSNVVVDRVINVKPPFVKTRIDDKKLSYFYGSSTDPMPEYVSKDGFLVYANGKKRQIKGRA
jgi:predicted methyltransferase